MKKYERIFKYKITTKQYKENKKRAKDLGMSMAQYIRYITYLDHSKHSIEKSSKKIESTLKNIDYVDSILHHKGSKDY